MAEKITEDAVSGFDPDALRTSIKKINAAKEKASEASGAAGAETKNACEQHNFNKTALTFCSRLARKEADEQVSVAKSFLLYAETMGFFDQLDLFDDSVEAMRRIIQRVDSGTTTAASNVARLARPDVAAVN